MSREQLIQLALDARQRAYAPYSNFLVGAALLCEDGTVYQGCNIENAAYSVCNCAERTALFHAVNEGKRDFVSIAIVGGKRGEAISQLCAPCGVCRQALAEFCDARTFLIHLATKEGQAETHRLCDLLPQAFTPKNLS